MNDDLGNFHRLTRPNHASMARPAPTFRARSQIDVLMAIVAEVLDRRLVMAVAGEHGVGKTTLIPVLAAELRSRNLRVLQVDRAKQTPLQVHRLIGEASGIISAGEPAADQLLPILQAAQGGSEIVLLIDDADALSATMCRYLRLLTDLRKLGSAKIQLVLLGRWECPGNPDLDALRGAAVLHHRIPALTDDEAVSFINHKLAHAALLLQWVMTKAAARELTTLARGLPGRLEVLAELVLDNVQDQRGEPISLKRLQQLLPEDWTRSRPTRQRPIRTAAVVLSMAVAGATILVLQQISYVDRLSVAADSRPAAGTTASSPALQPIVAYPSIPPPAPAAGRSSSPAPSSGPGTTVPVDTQHAEVSEPSSVGPDLDAVTAAPPSAVVTDPPVTAAASAPLLLEETKPQPTETTPAAAEVASGAAPLPSLPESPSPQLSTQRPAAGPDLAQVDALEPPRTTHGGPGLVLVAGAGDDLAVLYARVYRGLKPPPYSTVVAVNRMPLKPGELVTFPEPPAGWSSH